MGNGQVRVRMLPWAPYTKEIETQHKQAEMEKKAYEDLVRERDILSKVGVS